MKRHDINSSSLFRSAGFDPTSGVLELEYRNGTCRRWLAVPAHTYQGFCAALDQDAFPRKYRQPFLLHVSKE
ncbi:KTSC domain-containing protein [Pantoea ananatis]